MKLNKRDRYRSREPDQDGLVRIRGAISAKGRKSRSARSGTRLLPSLTDRCHTLNDRSEINHETE